MEVTITLIIIILTVVISLSASSKPGIYQKLLFNPYQVYHRKEWYRIFTHAFIHDRNNIFHLGFNMYVLYSFGNLTEKFLISNFGNLGIAYYLILYVGGIVAATIPSLIKHKDNYNYNSVGASGAVSAVLYAAIVFVPFSGFSIWFMPPLVFGIVYMGYEIYMDKKSNDNVAHDAHIWGAIFGFLFIVVCVPGAFSHFITQVMAVLD